MKTGILGLFFVLSFSLNTAMAQGYWPPARERSVAPSMPCVLEVILETERESGEILLISVFQKSVQIPISPDWKDVCRAEALSAKSSVYENPNHYLSILQKSAERGVASQGVLELLESPKILLEAGEDELHYRYGADHREMKYRD